MKINQSNLSKIIPLEIIWINGLKVAIPRDLEVAFLLNMLFLSGKYHFKMKIDFSKWYGGS
jgi:hypothetical protein